MNHRKYHLWDLKTHLCFKIWFHTKTWIRITGKLFILFLDHILSSIANSIYYSSVNDVLVQLFCYNIKLISCISYLCSVCNELVATKVPKLHNTLPRLETKKNWGKETSVWWFNRVVIIFFLHMLSKKGSYHRVKFLYQ